MRLFCYLLLFACAVNKLTAQAAIRQTIPFTDMQAQALTLAGGMGCAQFSDADLDGDGLRDLLVFDRVGNAWQPFRNAGSSANPTYQFAPELAAYFPAVESWALLRDYDCDGLEDIFCNYRVPSMGYIGIGVFRATRRADGRLQFQLVSEALLYTDPRQAGSEYNIFVSNIDIPAIDDIDGDGDMDILTFNSTGGYVELFANRSADEGYGCDSLIFELADDCWGRFYESGVTEPLTLSPHVDSCALYSGWQPVQRNPRHSGSTLALFDMNAGGLKDLFLGDVSFTNICHAANTGSAQTAFVGSQETFFPINSRPVRLHSYPAAYFIDVNGDGLRDMLATPSGDDYSENTQCAWLYENTGTTQQAAFSFQQTDFLVGDMLDVGGTSAPSLLDFDGDGLMDLVVGSNGVFVSTTNFRRSLYAYRNVGTATAPAFELVDTNFANLQQYDLERLMPAFADMDGDGDQDLIAGLVDGTLVYCENRGSASAPNFAQPLPNYQSIDVGNYSAPCLWDVDEDGKIDLIIGERNGNINLFLNTGTASAPQFSATPTTQTFGMIDTRAGGIEGNSAPFMLQWQGVWVLLLGKESGGIDWYEAVQGNLSGAFTRRAYLDNIDEGRQSVAAAADLNADGFLDIFVGNKRGGLGAFRFDPQASGVAVSPENVGAAAAQWRIYPNPLPQGQNLLYLQNINSTEAVDLLKISVLDAQGRLCQFTELSAYAGRAEFVPNSLAAGAYFLRIESPMGSEWHKLLIP